MNYELIKNKVWKTLILKKRSRKTHPGKEGGWLLGCEVAEISNLANSTISLPLLFPRGSWATIGMHLKNIFWPMNQILKEIIKTLETQKKLREKQLAQAYEEWANDSEEQAEVKAWINF